MFKLVVVLSIIAVAHAQYFGAHHGGAIVGQDSNILRSYGNLGQIATHSKSISTPYSSVHKSDVRVSNPGLTTYGGYGAHGAYGGYASPIVAHGGLAHAGYASPLLAHGGLAHAGLVGAPLAAHGGLLGVRYSIAPQVAHMTYSNGLGLNYAW